MSTENSGRWGPGSREHGMGKNTRTSARHGPLASQSCCPAEKGCSRRRAGGRLFQGPDLG